MSAAMGEVRTGEQQIIEVDFKPAEGDEPLHRVKRRDYSACQHRATQVDEVLRRVTCKACGETLDPIEVLLMLAHEGDRWWNQVQALRQESARREKEIVQQRRIGNNLRAAVRRWVAKAAAAGLTREDVMREDARLVSEPKEDR